MQAATENSDDHDVDPADVGQPIQPPVTVTRLADAARVVGFAGTPYAATRRWVRRLTGRACWRTTGSPTASRHPGRFFLIATEHDTPKRARAYLIPDAAVADTLCTLVLDFSVYPEGFQRRTRPVRTAVGAVPQVPSPRGLAAQDTQ